MQLDPKENQVSITSIDGAFKNTIKPEKFPSLALFYNKEGKARTFPSALPVIPSYHHSASENNISLLGTSAEQKLVWDLIQNPPAFKDITLQRQSVIEHLSDRISETKLLHALSMAGHELQSFLSELFHIEDKEIRAAREEEREPCSRIQVLINKGLSAENIEERIKQAVTEDCHYEDDEKGMSESRILQYIGTFAELDTKLEKFTNNLSNLNHDFTSAANEEFRIHKNQIPSINSEEFISNIIAGGKEAQENYLNTSGKLSEFLSHLGALFTFSKLVVSDRLVKVSFDEDKAEDYQKGWNLGRSKEGQTRNPSLYETPITILCGSNMSGKSFYMKSDLMIRLAAQAFGFTPAVSANLHMKDNFVWIERALTNGSANLSAFGADVQQRKDGLDGITQKTCIYSDEGWSSTSYEDERKLSIGELKYLRDKNARVMTASHNEGFLDYTESQDCCSVHHFKTALKEDGTIEFMYKLLSGRDDSHAFEVAKRLELPAEFLIDAKAWQAGEWTNIKKSPSTYPTAAYLPEERERLKKLSYSMRSLAPTADELIISLHGESKFPRFNWYLQQERDRGSYFIRDLVTAPAVSLTESTEIGSVTSKVISQDAELRGDAVARQVKDCSQSGSGFVGRLLRGGGTDTSAEVLERQQMFRALMEGDKIEELTAAVYSSRRMVWLSSSLGNGESQGFNTTLISSITDEVGQPYSPSSWGEPALNHKELNLFKEIIDFNLAACGVPPEVSKDLYQYYEKISSLISLNSAYIELLQDWAEIRREEDVPDAVRQSYQDKTDNIIKDTVAIYPDFSEKYHGTRDFDAVIGNLLREIHGNISPYLRELKLDDLNDEFLKPWIEKLSSVAEECRKKDGFRPIDKVFYRIELLQFNMSEEKPLDLLVSRLREFDSVHLHQISNYFERVFSSYCGEFKSGAQIREKLKSFRKERDWGFHIAGMETNNANIIAEELDRFSGIISLAKFIKEEKWCPVTLSSDGTMVVVDAWGPFRSQYNQVKNSFISGPDENVMFATGVNMSGKSFHQKMIFWLAEVAQATGFTSAASARLPVFAKRNYFDRIPAQADLNLSSFGTEAVVWKSLLEETGRSLNILDEPGSSTSLTYRDPLTAALGMSAIKKGSKMILSCHSPEMVDRFLSYAQQSASAFHFQTEIGGEGALKFDYLRRPGIAESRGIEVAEWMGLNPRIIQYARES